ncbi:hypothetical protein EJ06DRAFT_533937 [Trichodelitschia bisporula]|uniref:Uncharacterized protein n=1 Tax=Trichodelitschia bisporula TaxID=703511 RepID=A0A6G1HKT6_9PEZI|nr:hypothetical protein EJ06DRAFT_533937 [Trichodelitschia bisporula]
MAEQDVRDVVKEAQSAGDASSADVIASTTSSTAAGNGKAQQIDASSKSNLINHGGDSDSAVANYPSETHIVRESALHEPADSSHSDGHAGHFTGDMSAGSDTDTSKPEGLKDGGHARSNSLKKPTTFKSVSVTKNFLAKAAVGAPNAKPTDKGPSTAQTNTLAQQTAKPRLVAKSALGGGASRAGVASMSGAGTGPDASKVWNKNRPIPPAPPRQFTDEELQTRYGIHLATRLQSDESGKDPKWADIDDDEDDWAPETVEWMDGTKSNIVTADTHAAPPSDGKKSPSPVKADKPVEASVPIPATTPQIGAVGTSKTILKPSVPAPATKPGSLVLKGASERPTLVAKASTAVPAKSPWASLPPIDKVSPVVVNPPQPASVPKFQRDPHSFDSLPPLPAKEIAADDFNRTWREDRGNKELFNSQSGRYEPVNDTRRAPVRDHGPRQPAVLQRPSQPSAGPAEPSLAFQTSRSGGGEVWARRRTSSNVSGGSAGRRLSVSRPVDFGVQPEGMSPISVEQAESVTDRASKSFSRTSSIANAPIAINTGHSAAGAVQPPGTAANGTPQQEAHPVQSPALSVEDPVAMQNRLMREKIERAKLAKQLQMEAEAQEETERKARLALKVAALAATPSPKLADEKPKETPRLPVKSPSQKPAPVASPPKPPIPTSEGEVAQYGMIKVHQPHPVKKSIVTEASLTGRHAADPGLGAEVQSHGPPQPFKPVAKVEPTGNANIRGPMENKRLGDVGTETPSASWKPKLPSDSYNWGNNAISSNAVSNVWAPPPSNERALGNGTFEHNRYNTTAYNRSIAAAHGPPPPTTLEPVAGHVNPANEGNNTFTTQQQRNTQSTGQGRHPPLNTHHPRVLPNISTSQQLSSAQLPPIPPPHTRTTHPSSTTRVAMPTSLHKMAQVSTLDDWTNAPKMLQEADEANRRAFEEQMLKNMPVSVKTADVGHMHKTTAGGTSALNRKVVKSETFEHAGVTVTIEPNANAPSKTNVGSVVNTTNNPPESGASTVTKMATGKSDATAHVSVQDARVLTAIVAPNMAASHSQQSTKNSRFFPRGEAAGTKASSESPPPPELENHPVYDGSQQHPKVNLPNPKPTVRLPPKNDTPPTSPDETGKPDWQAKINSLFGNKSNKGSNSGIVQARRPSRFAFGAQDVRIELAAQAAQAAESKTTGEELFEDREFASTPKIHLPTTPHKNAHLPANATDNANADIDDELQTQSVATSDHLFSPTIMDGSVEVVVKFPGQERFAKCYIKVKPERGGYRSARGGYRQNNRWNSSRGRGGYSSRQDNAQGRNNGNSNHGYQNRQEGGPSRTDSDANRRDSSQSRSNSYGNRREGSQTRTNSNPRQGRNDNFRGSRGNGAAAFIAGRAFNNRGGENNRGGDRDRASSSSFYGSGSTTTVSGSS